MYLPSLSQIAEKWKHEGFRRYFANTGWLFMTRIATMAMGFVVVAIIARYLGPTNYGTLSYALSFVGLFSFIASLGIDNVLYRDLVKYPERENEFIGTALTLRFLAGIVSTAVIVAAVLISPEEQITRGLIIIISISYLFQAFNTINYCFQARVQAKYSSITSVIVVVTLSALKLGIVYWGQGVYYLAAVYALEPLLYGVFFLLFYKKLYGNPFNWYFKKDTAKEMLHESLPLILSSAFVIIYSRIDQVMIKHMIDVTSVGLYDAAVRLSEVWYFLPGIIVNSLYPSIVNAHSTDEQTYAKRLVYLTTFLVAISALVSIVATVCSQWIITLVYGEEFLSAYRVLQLYVWSGIGISIGAVLNQYLITEKLASRLLHTSVIGMVLNIVLNLIFIPRYGISGAALATLISYIAGPLSIMLFTAPRTRIMLLLSKFKPIRYGNK